MFCQNYAYKSYEYNLKNIYNILLKVLDLVIISVIFYHYNNCLRIMNVYYLKLGNKTKKFIKIIYYNYKQVINKLK